VNDCQNRCATFHDREPAHAPLLEHDRRGASPRFE
jgi:hypothetical protein